MYYNTFCSLKVFLMGGCMHGHSETLDKNWDETEDWRGREGCLLFLGIPGL